MKIVDDVFQLTSEVLRNFSHKKVHECNISMVQGEFMTDEDFIYQAPETPYYLEEHGLMEINSTEVGYTDDDYWVQRRIGIFGGVYRPKQGAKRRLDYLNRLTVHGINLRGFFAVSFNVAALQLWFDNELAKRLGNKNLPLEQIPDGWKWEDQKSGTYQFGELGSFSQEGKIRGKVFVEAMKIFEESPQAISIKSLSQRTDLPASRLRIEISAINKKLAKKRLALRGSYEGYYRIEILSFSD
jgi:hypothetical protein